MEINTIVIDTNDYVEFKKGNQKAVNIVKSAKNIIITPIVVGELLAGFVLGNKEAKNRT